MEMYYEVVISYDCTASDAFDAVLSILNNLGVEYTMSGEEVVTIKYKVKK